MKIGMVGLGRMGANMTERLRSRGHDVIGYDRNPETSEVASLDELVGRLERPRTIWCMVPSGDPTEETIRALAELLDEGDLVVDGGNSYFRDSLRRAEELDGRGILFCDAGVSGGIWGLAEGYCLMVGGTDEAIQRLEPALVALAQEGGYAHVGPVGTGHFVKMVHNGIEYGLLQAYGEGFQLLQASSEFPDLDLSQIAEVWRQGRSCGRGSSTSRPARWSRIRASTGSAATSRTPARDAGPSSRPFAAVFRCRRSRTRCSLASTPATTIRSR